MKYEAAFITAGTARALARLLQNEGNDAFIYFRPEAGPVDPRTSRPEGRWTFEVGRPGPLDMQLPRFQYFPSPGTRPMLAEELPKGPLPEGVPLPRISLTRGESAEFSAITHELDAAEEKLRNEIREDGSLRNDASGVVSGVRQFLKEHCSEFALPMETGGGIAANLRLKSGEVPPTCFALAELEWNLVSLADGNFHEAAEWWKGVASPIPSRYWGTKERVPVPEKRS